MKTFPSIPYWNKGYMGTYIYAFDKLDGSNIRLEWTKKLSKKAILHLVLVSLVQENK